MKKQKTLKELERKANVHYWGLIIALVVMLVITIISLHTENINRELQTQLSLCQDKVPVWTLKISCQDIDLPIFFDAYMRVNITDIGFNLSAEFEDYEDYQDALDSFKELNEYCEVLE